jgi:heme oxygenase
MATRVLERTTLDTDILDTSKAFAGLLSQVQTVYQDRVERIYAPLTEEPESRKAEQRAREDLLKERIAALEMTPDEQVWPTSYRLFDGGAFPWLV